jgi:hypothetical protein
MGSLLWVKPYRLYRCGLPQGVLCQPVSMSLKSENSAAAQRSAVIRRGPKRHLNPQISFKCLWNVYLRQLLGDAAGCGKSNSVSLRCGTIYRTLQNHSDDGLDDASGELLAQRKRNYRCSGRPQLHSGVLEAAVYLARRYKRTMICGCSWSTSDSTTLHGAQALQGRRRYTRQRRHSASRQAGVLRQGLSRDPLPPVFRTTQLQGFI